MLKTDIHFTDLPVKTDLSIYSSAIKKVKDTLKSDKNIISVFKFGNISDPGISDIDILAVVSDNEKLSLNPLAGLTPVEKSLFTHSVFVLSESEFKTIHNFTHTINYELLAGRALQSQESFLSDKILNTQIALEYLFINYIARNIEHNYRYVKVRGYLLSLKAVKFDLQLLNIDSTKINKLIEDLIILRKEWFNISDPIKKFSKLYNEIFKEYNNFAESIMNVNKLYFPAIRNYRFARNIKINKSDSLNISYDNKFPLISIFKKSSYYKSLISRAANFEIGVRMNTANQDSLINQRFDFYSKMLNNNKILNPGFTPFANQFLMKFTSK